MKLYIANCTRQNQKVFYRLDFNPEGQRIVTASPPKQIVVPSGHQVAIDLKHISQIQGIMDQLAKVGARGVEEKNRLPKTVVPYILSAEKPVPRKLIEEVHLHNLGVLGEAAGVRRRHAAIAASSQVQKAVDATVKGFEVEIEQQPPQDGEAEPDGKPVEEGLRVDLSAVAQRSGGKGGRRGRNKE